MASLASILGLSRSRHERAGFQLYGRAVAAAREPYFYTHLGVPDTLDGRFDLVGLHAFLMIRRLGKEPGGSALAQAIFDAMFADMDINLRELGVGDMGIARRVRAMWEGLHGRAAIYAQAMDAGDATVLEAALTRNVWRGEASPAGAGAALARLAFAEESHLMSQPLSALLRGEADFMPVEQACR